MCGVRRAASAPVGVRLRCLPPFHVLVWMSGARGARGPAVCFVDLLPGSLIFRPHHVAPFPPSPPRPQVDVVLVMEQDRLHAQLQQDLKVGV